MGTGKQATVSAPGFHHQHGFRANAVLGRVQAFLDLEWDGRHRGSGAPPFLSNSPG